MQRNVCVLRYIVWVCVLGTGLFVIADSMIRPEYRQGDFHTYYTAAETWAQGESPYVIENLRETANARIRFPFLYPPITLPFFKLFTYLPFEWAARVWVLLKLCVLAGLIWIWRRFFIQDVDPLILAVLLVFGFNHALAKDFLGGNLTVVMDVLIWGGLACMLRSRPVWGAAIIAVAASVKLTPILLIIIPLLFDFRDRRNWIAVSVGAAVFAGLILAPYLVWPETFMAFRDQTGGMIDLTTPNRSQPFGLNIIVGVVSELTGGTFAPSLPLILWAACLAGLALLSRRPLLDAWRRGDRFELVMYAIILYGLCVLRPRPYILFILIVPVLAVFLPFFKRTAGGAVLTALIFSMQSSTDWPMGLGRVFAESVLPWISTLVVWCVFCVLYDPETNVVHLPTRTGMGADGRVQGREERDQLPYGEG